MILYELKMGLTELKMGLTERKSVQITLNKAKLSEKSLNELKIF